MWNIRRTLPPGWPTKCGSRRTCRGRRAWPSVCLLPRSLQATRSMDPSCGLPMEPMHASSPIDVPHAPLRLILIGMPGSGKSTVGRQLARRLDLPFIDSDHEIEQRLGCPIREFFEREGEGAFRDIEESLIGELAQRPTGVLATGGGAVQRPANRQRLHQAGQVIYLRSTPEELFRRVRHDSNRPLLQVADPMRRLR